MHQVPPEWMNSILPEVTLLCVFYVTVQWGINNLVLIYFFVNLTHYRAVSLRHLTFLTFIYLTHTYICVFTHIHTYMLKNKIVNGMSKSKRSLRVTSGISRRKMKKKEAWIYSRTWILKEMGVFLVCFQHSFLGLTSNLLRDIWNLYIGFLKNASNVVKHFYSMFLCKSCSVKEGEPETMTQKQDAEEYPKNQQRKAQ